MLKSCQYCGKIHDKSFDCGFKPKKIRYKRQNVPDTEANAIRKRNQWTNKSLQIRQRDDYMCQCCKRGIYPLFFKKKMDDNVEVHHIVPINEDRDRAFDDYNLITLCKQHHEAAEAGLIDRDILHKIAKEQSDKWM